MICFIIFRRAREQILKEEELHITAANEKALQDLKEKLNREMEHAKLELLEVDRFF